MKSVSRTASRVALWLSVLLFAAVWCAVAITADDELPGHFDASGKVDRWDSTWSLLGWVGGIAAASTVVFAGARWVIPRLPGHTITLPNADAHKYWTAPENRPEFDRRIAEDLEWMGAATVLLMVGVTAISGTITDDAAAAWVLPTVTGAYLLAILGYCIYMLAGNRYRVPNRKPTTTPRDLT